MDYRELFEQVAAFLKGHGYSFVVQQVREELVTGHLSEERISTLAEDKPEQPYLSFERVFKLGAPAEFVKRAEYTDAESVALLLEAARRAICDSIVMVSDLRNALDHGWIPQIEFVSEHGDEEGLVIANDVAVDPVAARNQGAELDKLIQAIRTA